MNTPPDSPRSCHACGKPGAAPLEQIPDHDGPPNDWVLCEACRQLPLPKVAAKIKARREGWS